MYEHNFAEKNSIALNKIFDEGCGYCSTLSSDIELNKKQEELFCRAENWLNYLGIKTRTEYNNLLPTYNLFLEIGEYLQRRKTEENDE